MHFAGAHFEVDLVECNVSAETLRQPLYFKQYRAVRLSLFTEATRVQKKSSAAESNPHRD